MFLKNNELFIIIFLIKDLFFVSSEILLLVSVPLHAARSS